MFLSNQFNLGKEPRSEGSLQEYLDAMDSHQLRGLKSKRVIGQISKV
jgi:hypothetical protein